MPYTRQQLEAIVVGQKYFPQSEIAAIQGCADPNRLGALAEDPDHDGQVSPKSLHEAVAGLALEQKGPPAGLQGPITRDLVSGRGEFVEANGVVWDMKSPISYIPGTQIKPRKGGFDLNNEMQDLEQELDKGENVILDATYLDPGDKAALQAEIARKQRIEQASGIQPPKWTGRIIWYP
jgi:hypothetical protein